MKYKIIVVICVLLGIVFLSCSKPKTGGWMVDVDKVKSIALESEKEIFIKFVGSDWCPYCKLSEEELFTQEEFKTYADEYLVLLNVDRTRDKNKSTPNVDKIINDYGVRSFPTFVILDHQGKEINRKSGYSKGSSDKHMEWIIMNTKQ